MDRGYTQAQIDSTFVEFDSSSSPTCQTRPYDSSTEKLCNFKGQLGVGLQAASNFVKQLPWEEITDVGKKLEASAVAHPAPEQTAALEKSGMKLVSAIDKMIPSSHKMILIWSLRHHQVSLPSY